MSVRHRGLKMNKKLLSITFALLTAGAVAAQGLSRHETLLRANFWNEGSNPAGLRLDSQNFASAQVDGLYRGGDFRGGSEPVSFWQAGASAMAVQHLDKFSMRGSFGFVDRENYEACGSMFRNPGYFPMDVLEFTPGRKTSQEYFLYGGVSVDLGSGWTVGAALDFLSANTAKRKDLRYTDYALSMKFTPSVLYRGEGFVLGLSAVYERDTETVSAEQIGSSTSAPQAFFDEGLMTGALQAWKGSQTHLSEAGVSGLPVVQNAFGAAMQVQWSGIYLDVKASWLDGHVGERQIVWYRYAGPRLSGLAGLRFGRHSIRARAALEQLTSRESVMDKVVEGGVTIVHEYGSNQLLSRGDASASLEYECLGRLWEARAAVEGNFRRTVVSPKYPYIYTNDTKTFRAGVDGTVHIWHFDISAAASFSKGWSVDVESLSPAASADGVEAPYRMEDWYLRDSEMQTAPLFSAGLSLRWRIARGLSVMPFGEYRHALRTEYAPGPGRWTAGMRVEYDF